MKSKEFHKAYKTIEAAISQLNHFQGLEELSHLSDMLDSLASATEMQLCAARVAMGESLAPRGTRLTSVQLQASEYIEQRDKHLDRARQHAQVLVNDIEPATERESKPD